MNCPIVVVAFGTATRAKEVYSKADARLKRRFPDNPIFWAYSSRIVRDKWKERDLELPSPLQVLDRLASEGREWAALQSFNIICGHEFHRIREEAAASPVRTSVGHSLLCGPEDFEAVARALDPLFEKDPLEAVVAVGHGTDHCAWTVFPAFERFLRIRHGSRAVVGIAEGQWPTRQSVVEEVLRAGFRRVRLIPLMLVAGMHFERDLCGPEDSWKSAFEERGVEVAPERSGLGEMPAVIDVFADHIRSALDVIPRCAIRP